MLLRAKQDRLENWRLLQELSGGRGQGPAQPTPLSARSGNGHGRSPRIGDRIRYHDGKAWIAGIVESLEPACLALEDESEIRVTSELLKQSVAAGVVVASDDDATPRP